MHVAYWIVAALLALFYLYAGGKKLLQSQAQLRPMMAWVDQVPMPRVKAVGGLEVLGALGLVLPRSPGSRPASPSPRRSAWPWCRSARWPCTSPGARRGWSGSTSGYW